VDARFCPACGKPVEQAPPSPPGRERRVVTILFADLTGSTGLGERLDPERLREVLETYFAAIREELQAEGGTVEKFIGDAVMAAFGVPVAHEDDAARALRAALRIRRRLEQVNRELEPRFGVTLEIRTGVNTGEVLAATVPEPGEPMVTGAVVNTAARLEQSAAPGEILVAERTARAARGFRYEELGMRELRGKQTPVPAVVLLDAAPERPERGVPGLRAPMVGRDQELALLQVLFRRVVAEGRPNLVTIYGDPGVGKSRLVREFLAWAEGLEASPRVVVGRSLPYGEGVTYWPLAEILKGLAGVRDTDPPAATLERILAFGEQVLTAEVATNPRKAAAALAYTVGVEDPEFPFRSAEPREIRAKTHTAWRSLFSGLARRSPVVAVIEDLHWADPALLGLLEELAERVVGPVLFLCPARPELAEQRPGWGGGRRNYSSVALEPLSPEDADRLVGFLLEVEDLPASVHRAMLERAEGNPFFLEEIVRHMIDEGVIVRDADRWRASAEVADVHIPDTVQAVLAARIDLLDPAEKRTLQRAAVVGRVFWPGPVGRLLNGEGEHVRETLGRLEERELVLSRLSSSIAGEPEFAFKHVLTREVAYESLPRRERATAHAQVAAWIEETAGERATEFVELLAYHYAEAYAGARDGGDADPTGAEELRRKAYRALLAAAEEARLRFAVRKATVMVDRALALSVDPIERADALDVKGSIALNDYQGDLAWTTWREAVQLRIANAPSERRAIARACARAVESPLRWPGSMKQIPEEDEVRRYLELGFDHLDDEESEEGVWLLASRAFEPFAFAGKRTVLAEEYERSLADGERAADIALRLGRPDLASSALDGASSAAVTLGLYGPNQPTIERRLALADVIEDPWEAGDIFAMGAWTNAMIGNYEESIRLGMQGRTRTEDQAEGILLHNTNWVGFAEFQRGAWDRTSELLAQCEALLGERADDPPYFMMALYGAAGFVSEARAAPEAERLLSILRDQKGTTHGGSVAASYWLAWALSRRGRHAEAQGLVNEVAQVSSKVFQPFQDQVGAELLAAQNRWDDVPAFLAMSRAYAAESGLRALPSHLDRLEGRAALARGRGAKGMRLLEVAREGFGRLGAVWERARTELFLAEALTVAGRHDEALPLLGPAIDVFEALSSMLETRRARALLSELV
jgi:class 3 adenylate cyclase